MIATALALGTGLAYIFGAFMARPLAHATTKAAAVGAGAQIEPLQSPLMEANTLTAALSDASAELKRRQEYATFLMGELAHRSKNQLAVVNGMALQTAKESTSIEQFIHEFGQRIQGLAQSQDLMVRQNWQGAWLGDLVQAHLDLFGAASRADIEGPRLFLNANAVQNVGFALHELATNASKHGVLLGAGRILVAWRHCGDRVVLEWTEHGGPPAQIPDRQGFGYLVLTQLVPQALQGAARLEFASQGCEWRLDFPAHHVLTSDPNSTTAPSP
jgi:two-component sensor histidine kinase